MKSVYLNYTNHSQTAFSAWLLLLSGALVLAASLFGFQQIKARNAELQRQLQTRAAPEIAPVVRENPQAKKATEAVDSAIRDIATPWASLWKALEAATAEGVKMLTLEPSVKTRTVRMRLIALDHAAMWAYLHNLNQQTALHNVRLISSEATDVSGQHAVAFLVEAAWRI
jgi:Tfp pilus assembly protein PilN